jgi:hypothetical protein
MSSETVSGSPTATSWAEEAMPLRLMPIKHLPETHNAGRGKNEIEGGYHKAVLFKITDQIHVRDESPTAY